MPSTQSGESFLNCWETTARATVPLTAIFTSVFSAAERTSLPDGRTRTRRLPLFWPPGDSESASMALAAATLPSACATDTKATMTKASKVIGSTTNPDISPGHPHLLAGASVQPIQGRLDCAQIGFG